MFDEDHEIAQVLRGHFPLPGSMDSRDLIRLKILARAIVSKRRPDVTWARVKRIREHEETVVIDQLIALGNRHLQALECLALEFAKMEAKNVEVPN